MEVRNQRAATVLSLALTAIFVLAYLSNLFQKESEVQGKLPEIEKDSKTSEIIELETPDLKQKESSGSLPYGFSPMPLPPEIAEDFDCKIIGQPGIPNAFRAIGEAGKPDVWEGPPYLRVAGPFAPDQPRIQSEKNWKRLGYLFNGKYFTYLGDRICVRKER